MNAVTIANALGTSSYFELDSDATFKSTVILAAAIVAVSAFPRAPAAMKHRIWCLALMETLGVPIVSLVVPQWKIAFLSSSAAIASGADNQRTPDSADLTAWPLDWDRVANKLPAQSIADGALEENTSGNVVTGKSVIYWFRWLLVVWGAGLISAWGVFVLARSAQRGIFAMVDHSTVQFLSRARNS